MDRKGKITLFSKIFFATAGLSYLLTSGKAEFAMLNEKVSCEKFNEYNAVVFEDTLENYECYVDGVCYIIDDSLDNNVGEYNVYDVFAAYLEMQDNGCLSYGSTYDKDEYPVEIGTYWGINMITGQGVCRHTADNLANVLRGMGYESGVVLGEFFEGDKRTGVPNHAVTFVKVDDDIVLLDPMNETIYIKCGEYYGCIHGDYSFEPSYNEDYMHGYSDANREVYANKDDYSDYKIMLLEDFMNRRALLSEMCIDFQEYESEYIEDYELEIYKDLLLFKSLYETAKEELGEGATEAEIYDQVYNCLELLNSGKGKTKVYN